MDDDGAIVVSRPTTSGATARCTGCRAPWWPNLVTGVTEGYTIKMEIFGVGYRVVAKGSNLEVRPRLQPSGADHRPGRRHVRGGDADEVLVSGIDKQKVGQVAANIRRLRKSDPYKGKGIRYEGEQIRRKVGKTGK